MRGSGHKLHSTNPIERLNGEIRRRTDVVGIVPNDAIVRLAGAIPLEQNDEWAVQRARHMTLETIAQMSDDPLISLPAVASRSSRPMPESTAADAVNYTTLRDMIAIARQRRAPHRDPRRLQLPPRLF